MAKYFLSLFSPVLTLCLKPPYLRNAFSTLSMTLGRPAAIPDSYVRVELPKHDPESVFNNVNPQDVRTSTDFFNQTM